MNLGAIRNCCFYPLHPGRLQLKKKNLAQLRTEDRPVNKLIQDFFCQDSLPKHTTMEVEDTQWSGVGICAEKQA